MPRSRRLPSRPAGRHSGWSAIDTSSNPDWYPEFLARSREGQLKRVASHPERELAYLRLEPGARVLDVGCGTGQLTSAIADLVSPHGQVVGLDKSGVMLAHVLPGRRGPRTSPCFVRGDVRSLPFPDHAFDRTVATTLFQHLEDPAGALREMVRVTKSGGQVAVSDQDWSTHLVSTGRPALDLKLQNLIVAQVRNPHVIRDVPSMLWDLGARAITVVPDTVVVSSHGEQGLLPILGELLRDAGRTGVLSRREAQHVADEVRKRVRRGLPFESFCMFHTTGVAP